MAATHIELGRSGEDVAADWYRNRGYRILERNWRTSIGELDLVVRKGRLVVVVEVKTRRTDSFGVPALAVDAIKQQRIRRLAATWLAQRTIRGHVDIRFDVVAITGTRVDVYQHAF